MIYVVVDTGYIFYVARFRLRFHFRLRLQLPSTLSLPPTLTASSRQDDATGRGLMKGEGDFGSTPCGRGYIMSPFGLYSTLSGSWCGVFFIPPVSLPSSFSLPPTLTASSRQDDVTGRCTGGYHCLSPSGYLRTAWA